MDPQHWKKLWGPKLYLCSPPQKIFFKIILLTALPVFFLSVSYLNVSFVFVLYFLESLFILFSVDGMGWAPTRRLRDVVWGLNSLFDDLLNFDDPLNIEAADHFMTDRESFRTKVRDWIGKYAKRWDWELYVAKWSGRCKAEIDEDAEAQHCAYCQLGLPWQSQGSGPSLKQLQMASLFWPPTHRTGPVIWGERMARLSTVGETTVKHCWRQQRLVYKYDTFSTVKSYSVEVYTISFIHSSEATPSPPNMPNLV